LVGTYAVIRVITAGIEAALARGLSRCHAGRLAEALQKSRSGIGRVVMQDGFFLGGVLLVAFIVTTLFAAHLAPFLPDEVHMRDRLLPPTTRYWMGADLLGRDILSRVLYGGRYSLLIASAGGTGALLVGFIFGGLPRLGRGVGVALATPIVGILEAFPPLVLGMLMMTLLGQGSLSEVLAVTAALTPPITAALLQAPAAPQAGLPVPAAVLGTAWLRALVMGITLEATLNFLDVGLVPLIPNWGGDLKANLPYLHVNPAIVLFPGMAVVVAALAVNLMAESVRRHAQKQQLLSSGTLIS
jgi:peptide/nickel transport system permease protein